MLSAFPSSPAFDEACHLYIRTLKDFSGENWLCWQIMLGFVQKLLGSDYYSIDGRPRPLIVGRCWSPKFTSLVDSS